MADVRRYYNTKSIETEKVYQKTTIERIGSNGKVVVYERDVVLRRSA